MGAPRKHFPLSQTLCRISRPEISGLVSVCTIDISTMIVTATPLRSSMH